MSKFSLDLKKFKHVKSDDKSTTLQHDDGHIITIAHKPLSKELLKQISSLPKHEEKKMAEGGVTPDLPSIPASPQPEKKDGGGNGIMKMLPMLAALKDGGQVYADGGDVGYLGSRQPVKAANPRQLAPSEQADYHDKTTPEQDKQRHAEADETEKRGKAMGLYADGGDVADPNQYMTPMPTSQMPQPQFDSMQGQAPAAPVNPYAEQYEQTYQQMLKSLPPVRLPGDERAVQKAALNAVEIAKSRDEANLRNTMEDQKLEHDSAVEENNRRNAIGLPPLPVPAGPQTQLPNPPAMPSPGLEQAAQQPKQEQPQIPGMGGSHDPESMLSAGYNQRMAGIQQQAQAQGQLGEQQAQALQHNLEAQQHAQQSFQESYQNLEQERQAHMQDIKDGYIDPNAYWKDHSKVMSGIGMILAGFNPTNSPNAAINFLKYQMDQNIEAQKANLDAKQNMLTANLHQFGNLRDAMDMTRVMQNDIMSHELQMAAAKAQTPMAKAAALQAAGQLQMETAPMFQQFAMRRAMMNLANNGGSPNAVEHMLGYMRVVNPEMAKEMSGRYVPGVGLSAVQVPEKVRGDIVAKQTFTAALQDLKQWAQQHSGELNPAAIAAGRAKAAQVQNLYRDAINGGVFKEGEQKFLSSIVDAKPDKFLNSIRVLPKLNEVIKENELSLNVLKKNYGLPVSQPQAEPQYKVDKNGIKWMRGPKGEAIRVK